jgi:methylmalonyl-CoA mutase N-terminal domain/subunit
VAVRARAAPAPHRRPHGVLRGEHPDYKPLSVSGYHIREAGSTAAQELAFTLADGFGYVELGLSAGMDVDVFAPGLSFFFDAHVDFFEEIAKFRAARRIWARWMRDVYGAQTDKAQWLRFHTQTAGRLADRAAAVQQRRPDRRRGARRRARRDELAAHQRPGRDPALPSEQAAEIALRTQQVLMDETGVTNVADPLGGSWYVEALTDEIEAQAEAIFDRIRAMGELGRTPGADGTIQHEIGPMTSGILRGIEEGWFMGEIADAAFQYQLALEKGDKKVVGVNTHTGSISHELEILRVSHEVEREQVRLLADRKAGRDRAAVEAA